MGDVDGIGQFKKEGKCAKLGGGRTRASKSVSHAWRGMHGVWWFHPQNHRRGLVVMSSKPSEPCLVVCPQNHRMQVYEFGP